MRKGHSLILSQLDFYDLTKEQRDVIRNERYPLYFYKSAIRTFYSCNKRGYDPDRTTQFVIKVFEKHQNEREYIKKDISNLFMMFYIKSPDAMEDILRIENINFISENLFHLGSMLVCGIPYRIVKKVIFHLLSEYPDDNNCWNASKAIIIERKCCLYSLALPANNNFDLVKSHIDHFPTKVIENYFAAIGIIPQIYDSGVLKKKMDNQIKAFMDETIAWVRQGMTWEESNWRKLRSLHGDNNKANSFYKCQY